MTMQKDSLGPNPEYLSMTDDSISTGFYGMELFAVHLRNRKASRESNFE